VKDIPALKGKEITFLVSVLHEKKEDKSFYKKLYEEGEGEEGLIWMRCSEN
jgi:hypothetical protein